MDYYKFTPLVSQLCLLRWSHSATAVTDI